MLQNPAGATLEFSLPESSHVPQEVWVAGHRAVSAQPPLQHPGRGHHSGCWPARLTVPQVVEHRAVGKTNFSHCFACSTRATLVRDTTHSRAVSPGTKSQANFCCLKIKFGLLAVTQADG